MKLKKKIQQSPSGGNKSIKKEKGKPTTDLKYSFRDGSSLLSLEIEIEKKSKTIIQWRNKSIKKKKENGLKVSRCDRKAISGFETILKFRIL